MSLPVLILLQGCWDLKLEYRLASDTSPADCVCGPGALSLLQTGLVGALVDGLRTD